MDIILCCIIKDNEEHLQEQRQIDIDELLNGKMQIGRYFSLTYSTLLEILQQLENAKRLILINNFGSRYIQLGQVTTHDLLENYYSENEG